MLNSSARIPRGGEREPETVAKGGERDDCAVARGESGHAHASGVEPDEALAIN